jgi:Tol biopolymer transport system component
MLSIDVESGEPSEFVTGGLELEEGASWSPNGEQVVAVAWDRVNTLRLLGMYLFDRSTRPRLVAMSNDDGKLTYRYGCRNQSILYGSDPNGHHRLFVLDLATHPHHEIQPSVRRFSP